MSRRAAAAARRHKASQRRIALAAAVVVALVVAVVLLVLPEGDDGHGEDAGPAAVVTMSEMAFSPASVVAPEGVLRVENDGAVAHDLLIRDLGKGTPDVPPHGDATMDLSDEAPGTYTIVCDVPGHEAAGMASELTLG